MLYRQALIFCSIQSVTFTHIRYQQDVKMVAAREMKWHIRLDKHVTIQFYFHYNLHVHTVPCVSTPKLATYNFYSRSIRFCGHRRKYNPINFRKSGFIDAVSITICSFTIPPHFASIINQTLSRWSFPYWYLPFTISHSSIPGTETVSYAHLLHLLHPQIQSTGFQTSIPDCFKCTGRRMVSATFSKFTGFALRVNSTLSTSCEFSTF